MPKGPPREGRNLAGQVALGLVKVFGQPMEYHKGIVNAEQPILKGQLHDEVDRVLLEMGVPLQQPGQDWTFDEIEKSDSLTYAPVDDDTRLTLKDMQKIWIKAHKTNDYEKVLNIGKDIKTLRFVGNELLRLKRELQDCLRVDDLDRAIELRRAIKQHEMKRESFDAIYETSRFEDMIVMGEPSQQYLEEADRLEREQK